MDTSKYEILKLNYKEPLDSKLARSFRHLLDLKDTRMRIGKILVK